MSVMFKRSATIAVLITGASLCLIAIACGEAAKPFFGYAGLGLLILLLAAVMLLYRLDSCVRQLSRDNARQQEQLALTEAELRTQRARLEAFIDHTTDAVRIVDADDKVIQVNPAFEDLFGWSGADVIGASPALVPEPLRAEARRMREQAGKREAGDSAVSADTERLRKDGHTVVVNETVFPIRDGDGAIAAFVTLSRDIAERVKSEEMLRRSEKLAVIGQLAAGVAHEIRNPLTTLRGFVQLQRTRKESNPEQLEIMLAELDRINFIVSEFLILSKPQDVKFQLYDAGSIVRDVVSLLEPQANLGGVAIIAAIDGRLPPIKCECNQLKQVLINLVKNAVESMPEGGTVTIRAERAPADCIRIRIVDQGCGIEEEHLKRLGEPFFTNKPGGTGLGLMICQQIIAGHKGALRFSSEHGKGTSVDIVLPVAF